MRPHSLLAALAAFFAITSALPLNINLGAYSPALVVGDGSLSFKDGKLEAEKPAEGQKPVENQQTPAGQPPAEGATTAPAPGAEG